MKIKALALLVCIINYSIAQTDTLKLDSINPKVESKQDTIQLNLNPWQQTNGEVLLSPFLSYYKATSFRDSNGEKTNFGNDGKFTNYNPRLYFSFGLNSDKLNLFGSIPYFFNTYEDNNSNNSNSDFGEIELGLRFNLKKYNDNYLMGAVIAYLPAYQNNKIPFAGYERYGIEPRLIYAGTSHALGNYNNFHKVELGLRYFLPDNPLQLRLYASEGYEILPKIILLGELDVILSTSSNSDFFENNLQLIADYQMVKAVLNIGYEFSESFSIYGGLFHDIRNRNSAIGKGFQFFSVLKLN